MQAPLAFSRGRIAWQHALVQLLIDRLETTWVSLVIPSGSFIASTVYTAWCVAIKLTREVRAFAIKSAGFSTIDFVMPFIVECHSSYLGSLAACRPCGGWCLTSHASRRQRYTLTP